MHKFPTPVRWPQALLQLPTWDRRLVRVGWGARGSPNMKFPQPYYQIHAYGPGTQPVPDYYFPRPPMMPLATREQFLGMSENVREQVARTLREFVLEPKGRAKTYQKPYPDFFQYCTVS
jgi:hypothetical protein